MISLDLPTGPWTGEQCLAARKALGMTRQELAEALELAGGQWAKDTVRNWERDAREISGPARVAIRLMLKVGKKPLKGASKTRA